MRKTVIVIILACLLSRAMSAQEKPPLYINEFLANNLDNLPGELWRFNDWVEIYNAGNEPFNMGGMYFSDEKDQRQKWQIPINDPEQTTIAPKGYLLFWFDELTYLNNLHVDFKLNGKGEYIILSGKDGQSIIDSLQFGRQYPDISFGRFSDGQEPWTFFENPTPGEANQADRVLAEIVAEPVFSPSRGFYDKNIKVQLDADKKTTIYYTTDGREPSREEGEEYTGNIAIEKTTVIRAKSYKEGYVPSTVASHTYFINEPATLPVVSLAIDPDKLYEKRTGIYANEFSEIERPGHVEYFNENHEAGFHCTVGVKLTGRYSKEFAKKPFILLNRSKYGTSKIDYPIFDDPDVSSYDGFILRSDPTASKYESPKLSGERIKNELIYKINKEMGQRVDMQAYKPAVLFVNGDYWGLYNMMERKDPDFVKSHYGFKDIDMLNGEDLEVIEGDDEHYLAMLDYMNENNIREAAIYDSVQQLMDVNSFIDYWIHEIYYSSDDPSFNIRFWRPKEPGGKWRWLNFDHDSWHGFTDTTLTYRSTDTIAQNVDILGRLLQNDSFKNSFINRFADYLNTVLQPESIHRYVDEITAVIADEKIRDRHRWEAEMPFKPLGSQIKWVKDFATNRPEYLRKELVERFDLEGQYKLTVKNNFPKKGSVMVNSIKIDTALWEGIYFKDIPVMVEALPKPGFKFVKWKEDSPKSDNKKIKLQPDKPVIIEPEFK